MDVSPEAFISPCDARLSVYPITQEGTFWIKHTQYTLPQLLDDTLLAQRFEGGMLWIYRLCVDDYHRYIYPVDAKKSRNVRIPGIFPYSKSDCKRPLSDLQRKHTGILPVKDGEI